MNINNVFTFFYQFFVTLFSCDFFTNVYMIIFAGLGSVLIIKNILIIGRSSF